MAVLERLLERIELAAVGEPFHRAKLPSVRLHRERDARADRDAVQQDGARSTDAVLAADMRPRETERVAQSDSSRRSGILTVGHPVRRHR